MLPMDRHHIPLGREREMEERREKWRRLAMRFIYSEFGVWCPNESARTVYVVAKCSSSPHLGAVYQVQIELGGKIKDGMVVNDGTPAQLIGEVCEFLKLDHQVHKDSILECAQFGKPSELFVLLGNGAIPLYRKLDDLTKFSRTSPGFILNLRKKTPSCVPFSPPKAAKPSGIVMSAYGKLYFLAHPLCFPNIPEPSFEQYNPSDRQWNPLCPYKYSDDLILMSFIGYAVCLDTIVVSASAGCRAPCEYKVYRVNEDRWYPIENSPSYGFVGKAVVKFSNHIYAIPMGKDDIMSCTLEERSNAAGEIISYAFGTTSLLTGLEVAVPPYEFWGPRTKYLVHLGYNVFCHFETGLNTFSGWFPQGDLHRDGRQYMIITTFWIDNSKIHTLYSTIRGVPIKNSSEFSIKCCFTPDWVDVDPTKRRRATDILGIDALSPRRFLRAHEKLKAEKEGCGLGSRFDCLRLDSEEEEEDQNQHPFCHSGEFNDGEVGNI